MDDATLYWDEKGRGWRARSKLGGNRYGPAESQRRCQVTSYANLSSGERSEAGLVALRISEMVSSRTNLAELPS